MAKNQSFSKAPSEKSVDELINIRAEERAKELVDEAVAKKLMELGLDPNAKVVTETPEERERVIERRAQEIAGKVDPLQEAARELGIDLKTLKDTSDAPNAETMPALVLVEKTMQFVEMLRGTHQWSSTMSMKSRAAVHGVLVFCRQILGVQPPPGEAGTLQQLIMERSNLPAGNPVLTAKASELPKFKMRREHLIAAGILPRRANDVVSSGGNGLLEIG